MKRAKGLLRLLNTIDQLDNISLIIRFRPNYECSVKSLKALLSNTNCFELSTKGSFSDDLLRSNMLISYSSTCIEEALHARIPVGLFGAYPEIYRHIMVAVVHPRAM